MQSIDARTLPNCDARHSAVFQAFEGLANGEAFELVNDHDPRPLSYHLQQRYPNQFGWAYLEAGPDVWRVAIQRIDLE